MATKPKVTAKAEPTNTIMVPVTPKKRTKNPPPTFHEMVAAVRVRREGLIQFSALIVQLDNILAGRTVPADYAKALKENAKDRRAVKADIRRAIKVIARFNRAKAKGETLVK